VEGEAKERTGRSEIKKGDHSPYSGEGEDNLPGVYESLSLSSSIWILLLE
jgi:hypothetical protein